VTVRRGDGPDGGLLGRMTRPNQPGPRVGVLLLNLGTPDAPTTPAVRRYLREFLMDGRVIDLPFVARWPLVHGIIAPFRGPKSAAAYRSVWTAEGSPLLVHSRALAVAVADRLPVPVALAMRYGNPSIASALATLGELDELVVVPLFPQYASATTGSALARVQELLGAGPNVPALRVVPPLVQSPAFFEALAAVTRRALHTAEGSQGAEPFVPDAILCSYHGLPERHLRASRPACLTTEGCCDRPDAAYGFCYRAQCVATTRGLAGALGWEVRGSVPERHVAGAALPVYTSFQSRLGRDPWIQPYTEATLEALARSGVRRLAVACPSFVADCLETIEEIGERGAHTFRAAGGEELRVIPCLNAAPEWVDAVVDVSRRQLPT